MDILLIDEHPICSSALKVLLGASFPGFEVQTCQTFAEAYDVLSESPCKLALLGLDSIGLGALDHIETLLSLPLLQSVCVLSASDDFETIERCLSSGVSGFISKGASTEYILSVLKSVFYGSVCFPRSAFGSIMPKAKKHRQISDPAGFYPLTNRQREVARLVCQGLSNKEIANELGISEGTTKLHVSNIFSLTDVSKRSELIVKYGKAASMYNLSYI